MFWKGRRPVRRILSGNAPGGRAIALPHCWNTHDTFQDGVAYYRGGGSYRGSFTLDPSLARSKDRLWRLESEGFYGTGDVWLNGRQLARVDGQFLGVSLPVPSDQLDAGENTLAIRLTNRCRSSVLPGIRMPDYLLHGGLTGRLWLSGRPLLHFNERGLLCRYKLNPPLAVVATITFDIHNASAHPRRASVYWRVDTDHGAAVLAAEPVDIALAPGQTTVRTVTVTIPDARLWTPAKPSLYRLTGWMSERDRVVDTVSLRTGFREAEFRPNQGFFLNGQRIELRGCNRHASVPGFGSALPPELHRDDAVAIQSAGLNFVRLSHYPQDPAFLDACDELGLLVYAEIATWKSVRTGRWLQSACRQMRAMIERDRRHPSIILWGMGNESRSLRAYRHLIRVAREADPSRPVTYAENHLYRARRARTLGVADVWGCNYELDKLEAGCEGSLLRNVVVSECSNYPLAERGHLEAEAAQVALIEQDLARLRGRPYVAGFALWCFNDYATLRKRRYRRFSGLFDAWRLPKMSVALLRSLFMDEPFVALFGDWGRTADDRDPAEDGRRWVHVFTNGQRTVLLVNGRQVSEFDGRGHYLCHLPFEPGEVWASAHREGAIVEDRLVTYGSPCRLRASAERDAPADEHAAVIPVRLAVEDVSGHVVRHWHGHVEVTGGPGAEVRAYREDGSVRIDGGEGRVFVVLAPDTNEAEVRVHLDGLEPARCVVRRYEKKGRSR